MQPPLWPQIALQVILLLLTAFFSAAELSIPAQDEGTLHRQAQEGDRKAAQLLRLVSRPVRTRATMGRCQGGYCETRITEALQQELGLDCRDIELGPAGSWMFTGSVKGGGEA